MGSVKIGSELKHVMVIVGNVAGALNLSGDQGKIDPRSGQRKMGDTAECLAEHFGHNPTVNIVVSEFKYFTQNFDMIIFKF